MLLFLLYLISIAISDIKNHNDNDKYLNITPEIIENSKFSNKEKNQNHNIIHSNLNFRSRKNNKNDEENISLKNEFIELVFMISNNKVKSVEINNYRTDTATKLLLLEGTEEFLFSITNTESIPNPIDRSGWTVTSNSEQCISEKDEGPVKNIIDDNISTIWHSKYNDNEGGHDERLNKTDPFSIIFDLGNDTNFNAFSYTPRQIGSNGRIQHYEIYVSHTIEELNNSIENRSYQLKGDFVYDSNSPIYVNFLSPQKGRYVALLSIDHDGYGTGAEFNIYTDKIPDSEIKSSMFNLDKYEIKEDDKSRKITFYYKPFIFNEIEFNVTVEYELQKEKHYIEKQIMISIPINKYNTTKIDFLDLDHFVVSKEDKEKSWTHPFIESKRSDLLSKYIISLGQPVYINSFFTGCRFPFSDNQMVNNLVYNRYQSGKFFSQLKIENGFYRCWKTVIGAARSSSIEVVRNDFYSYISDISVENKFRKQYNSWYDWMMEINESNILKSFKEIEKGCSQFGVTPLDSYVIDDGWNNYNYNSSKYYVYDVQKSGKSFNKVGFWTMNDKFPDGFNKPSNFAHKIGSSFGVWLGPRGGYNFNSQLGHMIEESGFGFFNKNGNDIDVASKKYTEKLGNFLNTWIKEYKVNYYKLDGWLLKPCNDKDHDHMVGGYDGVYQFTDYWERYIDLFESMRNTADQNGVKNLWISLTCYVNPSPFHLQWANSIWVQISNDVGYTKITNNDSLADQMLNYRDSVYYEFYKHYQFQLPQQSVYNHDPIYGKTGTSLSNSLNDEEFRKYLLMCGMRGTSFFELYYSYTMLDEGDKWFVSSEVLNYIEKRFDVLKHSQMFGGSPEKGEVYGYSAWSLSRGTIAFRNPSDSAKEIKIKLNKEIGVPETIQTTYRKIILNFNSIEDLKDGLSQNYDDEITVTLQPREVRIIDFEPNKDTEFAEVEIIKAISQKEIQIRFNKKIKFDLNNYEIDHDLQFSGGRLRGDLRTVSLYLDGFLSNNTHYSITLSKVSDSIGNFLNTTLNFVYMSGNFIVFIPTEFGPVNEDSVVSLNENKLDSFTIQLNIKERKNEEDEVLIKDTENKVFVEFVKNHLKFTVGSLSVLSDDVIKSDKNVNITCVCERNKMLKIYQNGELSNSAFNKTNDSNIVALNRIHVCHSNVVYNSLFVCSDGYSYKDCLMSNSGAIRTNTAFANATSEVSNHEAFKAIDDKDETYFLSDDKKEEPQFIQISFDRDVYIDSIGYAGHNETSEISDYLILTMKSGSTWSTIYGKFKNVGDMKVANISRKVKYFRLGRYDSNISQISASRLVFYGHELECDDEIPSHSLLPTELPTNWPSDSPSKLPSNSYSYSPSDIPTNPPSISISNSQSDLPTNSPTTTPHKQKMSKKTIIIFGVVTVFGFSILIMSIIFIYFCYSRKGKQNQLPYLESLLSLEPD